MATPRSTSIMNCALLTGELIERPVELGLGRGHQGPGELHRGNQGASVLERLGEFGAQGEGGRFPVAGLPASSNSHLPVLMALPCHGDPLQDVRVMRAVAHPRLQARDSPAGDPRPARATLGAGTGEAAHRAGMDAELPIPRVIGALIGNPLINFH